MILSSWPYFDSEQIAAASQILASGEVNAWTGGETKAFEQEFAQWSCSSHAIAIANGSLALSAAYLALGLAQGDELITTPRTFIATASSAVSDKPFSPMSTQIPERSPKSCLHRSSRD